MMVRALKRGYHGRLREPGEVFEIGGRRELGSWMAPAVRRPKPPPPKEPAAAAPADPGSDQGRSP